MTRSFSVLITLIISCTINFLFQRPLFNNDFHVVCRVGFFKNYSCICYDIMCAYPTSFYFRNGEMLHN